MKKGKLIALIVAGVLLITGSFFMVMGLSLAKGSATESKLMQQEVLVQESFENIQIDTEDCDVNFVPYNGTVDARVVILEQERAKHSVLVEDGTLKIKMTDGRNWTDYVGIFGITEQMVMTVYLPSAEYESLQIRTTTGDIALAQEPFFRDAVLRTNTGDISCVGVSGDALDCMTSTGDISVQNSAPNMLKLQSNTGDFKISTVASDEIHMTTNTGEVDAQNVNALTFTSDTDTGDVELEKVLAEDYLQIFTDNGDVEIENSDAGTVNIETNTGDVSGNFLTSKWFQARSDTGNVTVPNTREGGECRIETDTGDISFFYDGSREIG